METLQIIMAIIFAGAFIMTLAFSLYFNVFEKEDKKGNKSEGGFGKLILAIIIIIAIFILIGMCSGDGMPWSPRHT